MPETTFAIIGATGVVGLELLRLLASDGVPADRVTALASSRSAGTQLPFGEATLTVRSLDDTAPTSTIALFAASGQVARDHAQRFVDAGSVVIDNSSAFRMADHAALVVPEVNGHLVRGDATPRIIANPNCSTIIMLMAVHPLVEAFGCERIIVSTYQAASGAGLAAMQELETNTQHALAGEPQTAVAFHEPCAFNVFSHDTAVDQATGLNVEEQKMIDETRKILAANNPADNNPAANSPAHHSPAHHSIDVRPTCCRVPVLRTHSESIHITLRNPATENQVRAALSAMPGVIVVDDRHANRFPTSLNAAGGHEILVGRIRRADAGNTADTPSSSPPRASHAPSREFSFLVAGDQLLKGAALNAWQIAKLVLQG